MNSMSDFRPFLVTGSGRCGTGYTAKCFEALGYPCGHEVAFNQKTVQSGTFLDVFEDRQCDSAPLAAPLIPLLSKNVVVFHQIRNPVEVVRSCMGIRLFELDELLTNSRMDLVRATIQFPANELEAAMSYWTQWNTLIGAAAADRVHAMYMIEELDGELLREMVGLIDPDRTLTDEDVTAAFAFAAPSHSANSKSPSVTLASLPDGAHKQQMIEMALQVGYTMEQLEQT